MKAKSSTKKHQIYTTKLGSQLHYYTKGSGEAVLLIHGFLGDASTWNSPRRGGSNIFNQLAENYHTIAVDNLGHGKSDKPHDSKHYGYQMVRDLIDLLDHLNIPKAHIIGYSMGSFIATNLILDYPNRVISSVLNAGVATTQEEFLNTKGFSAKPFATSVEELKQGKGVPTLARWLGIEGSPMATMSETQMRNFNKMMLKGQDEIALAHCLAGFPELFAIDAQKRRNNKIPILAMAGNLDKWQQFVVHFTKDFANLTFKPLEDVDHSLFGNKAADEAILSFINEH